MSADSISFRFLGHTTSFSNAVSTVQGGLQSVKTKAGQVGSELKDVFNNTRANGILGTLDGMMRRLENSSERVVQLKMEMARLGDVIRENPVEGVRQFQEGIRGLGGAVTAIGATITGVFGGTALAGIFKAGAFEQDTIAFGTMLGSAEEAKNMLGDLSTFAEKTPFEMPEIQSAARGLVQFGERGEELMETLNILGNASSGTSTNFGELALIFNQVRGVGKLLTQDFRQLSTRGVVSMQDLADHYGTTTEAAQKMLSSGKVGFEDLRAILKGLSEEGGRFDNLMGKQSKSFLGLISTVKDSVGIEIRKIGTELLPLAKFFVTVGKAGTDALSAMPDSLRRVLAWTVALTSAAGILVTTVGGLMLAFSAMNPVILLSIGRFTGMAVSAGMATASFIASNVALTGFTNGAALGALKTMAVRMMGVASASFIASGGISGMAVSAGVATIAFIKLHGALIMGVGVLAGIAIAGVLAYKAAWSDVTEEIDRTKAAHDAAFESVKKLNAENLKRTQDKFESGNVGSNSKAEAQSGLDKATKDAGESMNELIALEQKKRALLANTNSGSRLIGDMFRGVSKGLDESIEAMADLTGTTRATDSVVLNSTNTEVAKIEAQEAILREKYAESLKNKEGYQKLMDGIDPTKPPSPEALAAGEEYITQLRKQIATLGMSAEEAKRYEIAQVKLGPTMLKQIDVLEAAKKKKEEMVKAEKRAKDTSDKLADSFKSFTDGLKEQRDTLGMSGDELTLYRMKVKRLAPELVEAARKQMAHTKAMKKAFDLNKSIEDKTEEIKDKNRFKGMSPERVELAKFKEQRGDPEAIKHLEEQIQLMEKMEKAEKDRSKAQKERTKNARNAKKEEDRLAEAMKNRMSNTKLYIDMINNVGRGQEFHQSIQSMRIPKDLPQRSNGRPTRENNPNPNRNKELPPPVPEPIGPSIVASDSKLVGGVRNPQPSLGLLPPVLPPTLDQVSPEILESKRGSVPTSVQERAEPTTAKGTVEETNRLLSILVEKTKPTSVNIQPISVS